MPAAFPTDPIFAIGDDVNTQMWGGWLLYTSIQHHMNTNTVLYFILCMAGGCDFFTDQAWEITTRSIDTLSRNLN